MIRNRLEWSKLAPPFPRPACFLANAGQGTKGSDSVQATPTEPGAAGAAYPARASRRGRREAREETGLEVEFDRFILLIRPRFTCGPEFEDWTSYIFTAFMTSGELQQQDFEEN